MSERIKIIDAERTGSTKEICVPWGTEFFPFQYVATQELENRMIMYIHFVTEGGKICRFDVPPTATLALDTWANERMILAEGSLIRVTHHFTSEPDPIALQNGNGYSRVCNMQITMQRGDDKMPVVWNSGDIGNLYTRQRMFEVCGSNGGLRPDIGKKCPRLGWKKEHFDPLKIRLVGILTDRDVINQPLPSAEQWFRENAF